MKTERKRERERVIYVCIFKGEREREKGDNVGGRRNGRKETGVFDTLIKTRGSYYKFIIIIMLLWLNTSFAHVIFYL